MANFKNKFQKTPQILKKVLKANFNNEILKANFKSTFAPNISEKRSLCVFEVSLFMFKEFSFLLDNQQNPYIL